MKMTSTKNENEDNLEKIKRRRKNEDDLKKNKKIKTT
jgi:hypothetical protein